MEFLKIILNNYKILGEVNYILLTPIQDNIFHIHGYLPTQAY